MFGNKNIFDSDSHGRLQAEDAVFIGWQTFGGGKALPLYTITAQGHASCGSTVSDETLRTLNLEIPQTPPLVKR